MNVIEISTFGAPEVLQLSTRAKPVAASQEVLIKVLASGVNRPDVLQRTGAYPPPAGASDLPGLEVAGIIESGDAQAMAEAGLQIGDAVCALVAGGGYAQYCVAPIGQCLPVPKGLSMQEAASLPETFFTVWSNVFDRGRLQAGQTILIHGGSSGIGVTAIQLAKAMGATVLVTVGSEDKRQACLKLGADYAINYRTQAFEKEALQITQGKGVDVILDMVAGDYIAKDQECIAEDGRIVVIAVQGGVQAEINAAMLMRKRITLTGSTLRPRPIWFKTAIAQALKAQVWPLIEQKQIQAVIYQILPVQGNGQLSGAAMAHQLMESNQHIGKIVIDWTTLSSS
jgi:NADPH2:quinone reductase